MKAHIGVDADSGLVHSVITTPANVNDVTQANALRHGEEVEAYGDSGYQGADKRADQIVTLFALANLWMVRKKLLALQA